MGGWFEINNDKDDDDDEEEGPSEVEEMSGLIAPPVV